MTKSNKTLLCCLLTCVMVLACALTILPIAEPITANAATGEYTLVTSESDLKAGDKIIIIEKSKAVAAAAMGGGKFFTVVACTFPSENTVQSTDAIEITLGGKSGDWTLTTSEGIIGTKEAKALAISKGTTTWTISIAENGTATIASTDTSCGRILYNAGNSPRFLNYTSNTSASMLLPQIYKEATSEPACEHNYGTEIPQVNATCTVDGMKAHYKCSKCNKLFVLEGETYKEVSETSLVIKAAHTWGDVVATTLATCTTEGVGTATCTVCGESDTTIVIPKLDHDYSGANGTCVNGCGYTKDENTVIELYALGKGETLGERTLTGVVTVAETNSKVTMVVGSLEDKPVVCYRLTNGSSLKVGDKITVTGTLKDYNGTKEFDSGATYTLIKESLVINEKIAAGEGTIETNGKLYIKKGSKVVVTYSIDANTGINGLGGTFNYNKNFFAINDRANDIVVSNIFGTTVQLTGTETTAEAIKFLFVGKDGEENFNGNAVGDFISVTYTVIADITAADLAEMAFGLVDVQAVKEGNVALTDTELVVNNLADYNLAVTNKTTITVDGKESGATIERTYDGTIFSVGTTESDTYKLVSNRTDEPTITWTLGGEPATELKNAGTYTLTIEYAATAEYQAATATYTIVVKQVVLEKEMTEIVIKSDHVRKPLDKGSVSWDKNDFDITVVGLIEGEKIDNVATITFEPTTLTKPETVSMTVTLQLNGNYVYNDNSDTFTYTTEVTAYATPLKFSGLVATGEYYYGQSFDFTQLTVVNEHNEAVEVTIKITVAKNSDNDVELTTDELKKNFVKNAGSYTVLIVATPASADYEELNAMVEYTILPRTLSNIELVYTTDGEVSWTNATTYYTDNAEQTTALTDEIVLTYTVGGNALTENKFAPQAKGKFTIAVATNSENYIANNVETLNVYAVTFSYLATHDAETNTAIVKYVFDGQHAASIELPTETGYTFSGWYLLDNETVAENVFDFATTEIKNDITLTGKWTVNTYTVTFKLGNGQDDVTVSVNYGEKIADKIPADPTKAADDYIYTFKYWTLSTDETKAEVNVAEYVVSGDVTFVAEYDQTKNEFTVTLVIKYNDETITTETRVGKLGQTIELPSGIQSKVLKLGKWLYEDETEFDGKITKTATVTATYEIILEKGDVNGDGKVNLDDVVLFRKYLVGGYAIDEIADENIYTAITAADAASKTMFFKYSANLDNDANIDIRDVATIRMNVVVTTEGGEEQTQTTQSAARMEVVSEAVQYAVLPTNKFVA